MSLLNYQVSNINFNVDDQLALLTSFAQFKSEINFPKDRVENEYFLNNRWYGGIDASVLHCMIRQISPSRIVEVGSGYSTLASLRAIETNNKPCEFTTIDPQVKQCIQNCGKVKILNQKLEDTDKEIFFSLEAGDFLFIDSSHVVARKNDVVLGMFSILPSLKKGVVVHIHDIFLPYDYPDSRFLYCNEQYLVQAFLMFNNMFKIKWSSFNMVQKFPDKMKEAFPNCPFVDLYHEASSLWLVKII